MNIYKFEKSGSPHGRFGKFKMRGILKVIGKKKIEEDG